MSSTTDTVEPTSTEQETNYAGVEASGRSSFHILEKVIKEDRIISYGERLILKAIQSVGIDIVTAIRIYSGETTEDPAAEGDDGIQDEQTTGSNETD